MSSLPLSSPMRYTALFCLTTAALVVGALLYAHWGVFLQTCLNVQITLHRYLVMYLLQLNNHQYIGGIWLLIGAFFYGVLHAVGPGHGKFVVTTWLSTHQENTLAARLIPFLGSLLQGVSAIAFVFILAVGFNLAAGDLSQSRWYVEKASALLIGAFGVFLVYQAARSLRPRPWRISALTPLSHHSHHGQCGCAHSLSAQALTQGNWKTRVGVMLAVGARPCSGAIMILMFANALGIVSWGIAAVMTMASGTALSILGVSLAVRYARHTMATLFGVHGTAFRWLGPALKIAGGLLLILFATILFLTVIPASLNGDYIAAGC